MPYMWWHSGYDRLCHAFAVEQTTDDGRSYYEAACEHSVPLEHVEREQRGELCMVCLIKVGSQLADDGRWRG
jgi:hypothetical protein